MCGVWVCCVCERPIPYSSISSNITRIALIISRLDKIRGQGLQYTSPPLPSSFYPVLRSRSEPVLFGRSRSRCEDVKAKTFFVLLFSLFLYEKEPEPVKKKYLEPEPVKKGPAPKHCLYQCWWPVAGASTVCLHLPGEAAPVCYCSHQGIPFTCSIRFICALFTQIYVSISDLTRAEKKMMTRPLKNSFMIFPK